MVTESLVSISVSGSSSSIVAQRLKQAQAATGTSDSLSGSNASSTSGSSSTSSTSTSSIDSTNAATAQLAAALMSLLNQGGPGGGSDGPGDGDGGPQGAGGPPPGTSARAALRCIVIDERRILVHEHGFDRALASHILVRRHDRHRRRHILGEHIERDVVDDRHVRPTRRRRRLKSSWPQ